MTIKTHLNPATGKIEYTAIGSSIKADNSNRVSGYLVRFTSADDPDLHGEHFTKYTNFWLREHSPIGKPIMIDHAFDAKFKSVPVGIIDFAKEDEIGIWIEGKLKDRQEYEDMLRGWKDRKYIDIDDGIITKAASGIEQAVKTFFSTGKAQWSSGALPQSVEIDSDTGHIKSWALIEGTAVMTPAEPDGTEIKLKSIFSTLDEILQLNQQTESPTGRKGGNGHKGDTGAGADDETPIDSVEDIPVKDENEMDEQLIRQIIRMVLEEAKAGMPEEELPEEEEAVASVSADIAKAGGDMEEEELAKAVAEKAWKYINAKLASRQKSLDIARQVSKQNMDALKAQPATQKLPAFSGGNGNGRIRVGENLKYAHMSASDMALGVLMRAAPFKSQGMPFQLGNVVSPDYLQAMASKMVNHAESMPYGQNAKSATQFDLAQKANYHLKSIMATKANELDASTLAGQGDEWVGEFWSTDLWERERYARHYDTMVSKGMWVQTIERGAETAYFPTEGSDPVAYVSPQANSIDAGGRPETTININPFGTGRVSITPAEIKIATSHTTILDEDSVINVVQTVNRQLNEAAMDTRDKLMVNGDTQTNTTNVNYDGSTPATGLQTPYYIASNGFRKTGLAAGRDASNVLNLAQYRLTLGQLDGELRQYYEKMVFMIDPTTELASLAIAELATDDVRRTAATVTSGRLINIHGVDVLVNGFIPQTDTDGKVTGTGNIANRGTILLAYAPYWGVAYKRQVTLETARDIYSGSNVYVLSMRIGFVPRGSNAAVASYNVATAAS